MMPGPEFTDPPLGTTRRKATPPKTPPPAGGSDPAPQPIPPETPGGGADPNTGEPTARQPREETPLIAHDPAPELLPADPGPEPLDGDLAPLEDAPAAGDVSDLLPPSARQPSNDGREPLPAEGEPLLIHIVEDGFTAHGRLWYRGQELEYIVGDDAFKDTLDKHGRSWLAMGDALQLRRYGAVKFRRGPWPGGRFGDARAEQREQQRRRKPPVSSPLRGGG